MINYTINNLNQTNAQSKTPMLIIGHLACAHIVSGGALNSTNST